LTCEGVRSIWFFLCFLFKCVERDLPEAVEILANRFEAFGVQPVQAASALCGIGDQLRVFEDAQVLGNSRPADGEGMRQGPDADRPVEEAIEDSAASGVAEGIELA